MRDLLRSPGSLHALRWNTRFVFSLFSAFCLVAYAVMAAMAINRSGLSPASIRSYYLGNEAAMQYGKSYSELLEVTHFHLFSMPLLLFVQGHLFLMSSWPQRLKVTVVLAAAAGIACDLAAPWLVVYVSPELAPVKIAARVLMGPAFTLFAVVPLREMWRRPLRRGETGQA